MNGIKQNKFCKALDEKSVKELWEGMEYFNFKAGETIIKQGERGHHFFVCQEGDLAVDVGGTAAKNLGPGSAFGGISLLYNCARTATITAKSAATLWGVDGEVFRRILKEHSQKSAAENRKFLDSLQIFGGLDSTQKDRIGELALYSEAHEAGSRVFVDGEDASALYFLKSGDMTEWKGSAVGADGKISGGTKVAQYSNGDVFGVKMVLLASKRETTVVAQSTCELLVIGVKQLKEVLGEDFVTVLEQSFVLSILKRVPVISQAGLSLSQRQKIVQAMSILNVESEKPVGDDICLGVVIGGQISGKENDEPKTLQRGDWWQDEALSSAIQDANRMASSLKMSELAAGSTGARLATLRTQDLADALRELGLSPVAMDPEEVIGHMTKILLAKKVPIFRDISEEQINLLATSLVLKRFRKGACVFQQGEVGDMFYIVSSGEVKVLIDGKQVRLLGKGTCFGERALLFNERRSATVEVCSNEAEFWTLARHSFLEEVITEDMRAELIHRITLQDDNVTMKLLRHVKLIGAGAFGSVRLVEHKQKGVRYALKRVRKQMDSNGSGELVVPDEVLQECDLLASMDHPFVLRLVKSFETADSLYILTELITGGQLFEQTNERMGVLGVKQAQFYVASLVCILEAVHGAGIVYRDLKPENVMLDERGYLKLVDFGLAKRLDPDVGKTFTAVGTMLYMAPELIRGKGYGFEVDVWSLGVMFYELVCGQVPFGPDAEDEHELLGAILEDQLIFPGRFNDTQGKKLITGMLEKQPEKRTGCGVNGWEEVKAHKFFAKGVKGNLFSKIIGHDIEAPVVPECEQYSDERQLADRGVTLSDAEELGQDTPDDVVRNKVMSTFRRFDTNGDGKIDRIELKKLLQKLDPDTFSDENTEKLMDVVDINKDGMIQFEEFLAWVVGGGGPEPSSTVARQVRQESDLDIHM
jgi:cGMP-dependent protein kinase